MTSEEAPVAIIDALEAGRFDYMLAGSFSSNHYGIPRSTKDADFVIALGSRSIRELTSRLSHEFKLDPQMSFETITGTMRHIITLTSCPFTIELFRLSNDEHDQERFRRRVRVMLESCGRHAWLPTPEDVIVMKVRWAVHGARNKDTDDVRDVIAVQGEERLDWDYIYRWADVHGTRAKLDEIRRSIPPLPPVE